MKPHPSPFINERRKTIQFHLKMGAATHVSLAGSFNHWAKDELTMKHTRDDDWLIEIPMLPHGKYYYRFFIDDKMWMEDIENPLREPDGISSFYSVLTV
jgi:1,4-alpha-glucan branching enzyme